MDYSGVRPQKSELGVARGGDRRTPEISESLHLQTTRITCPSCPGPAPGVRVKASIVDLRRFAADFFSRFSASAMQGLIVEPMTRSSVFSAASAV